MCKELRLSDTDYSLVEDWDSEITEEYSESNLVYGFHTEEYSENETEKEGIEL